MLVLQVMKECKQQEVLILQSLNLNFYIPYYLFMVENVIEEIQILFAGLFIKIYYTWLCSSFLVITIVLVVKRCMKLLLIRCLIYCSLVCRLCGTQFLIHNTQKKIYCKILIYIKLEFKINVLVRKYSGVGSSTLFIKQL